MRISWVLSDTVMASWRWIDFNSNINNEGVSIGHFSSLALWTHLSNETDIYELRKVWGQKITGEVRLDSSPRQVGILYFTDISWKVSNITIQLYTLVARSSFYFTAKWLLWLHWFSLVFDSELDPHILELQIQKWNHSVIFWLLIHSKQNF